MPLTLNTCQFFFLFFNWISDSVSAASILISTRCFSIAAGGAHDVIAASAAIHHTNIGDFFLLLLKSRKCNTSRLPCMPTATPDAIKNQEEQYRQPIRKKEK
jgi:hypothetical protein